MNPRKQEILQLVNNHTQGLTAQQIATTLEVDRSNVSRYLNELAQNGNIEKSTNRPVIYRPILSEEKNFKFHK
ncbi:hypothetical protein TMUPMC115_1667 [Tetragenococcus muriaticus PMC-11-5]|uniref:Transcription regulator TrmB N-terminal domain-containing protein n=1 Tax=Tetragenococcus muriaticus PMC-11-5 TaxID=1302649 RepID=A0A091BZE4_9ENTE|nr:hypothetical protein TMUPMC115_1667 [Tetragenococcus muriaticus PMC-11-5]